jgi:hypothetical protein
VFQPINRSSKFIMPDESNSPTETTATPDSNNPGQQPGAIQAPESIAVEVNTSIEQNTPSVQTAHPTADNVGGSIPGNPNRDPIPTPQSVSEGVGIASVPRSSST